MSKLRLFIKRPERAHTCILVTVGDTDLIENCIFLLVDSLGLPRRDSLGKALTDSLRLFSGKQPFSNTL